MLELLIQTLAAHSVHRCYHSLSRVPVVSFLTLAGQTDAQHKTKHTVILLVLLRVWICSTTKVSAEMGSIPVTRGIAPITGGLQRECFKTA